MVSLVFGSFASDLDRVVLVGLAPSLGLWERALRKALVYLTNNAWFDRFITLCIITNSILLASKEYRINYDATYVSSWNAVLETTDVVFTYIFLCECLVKIVAMGFIL